ncbi:MAG: PHP domain-containing protein [Clostridia bacterium]|nr:PHP domain-containing protein [Clostridia bacterium]
MKIRYDLHLHSCLSPCGDDSMTPVNVAGLAVLEGLDLIALTDHNTALNCPAFLRAAEEYGIAAVPGMELTTSEDIHVVCLFETLEGALEFSRYVAEHSPPIKNKAEIFGNQSVMDENDEIIGEVERLLIVASDISINDIDDLIVKFGGTAFPAHIDKEANGVIAILGAIPPEAAFTAAELSPGGSQSLLPDGYRMIRSSDSHYPDTIGGGGGELELDCGKEDIIPALFRYLRGE